MIPVHRKATERHAKELAQNLRQSDLIEIEALLGEGTAEYGLTHSVRVASFANAVQLSGEVIALYGYRKHAGICGVPWFVGSPAVSKYPLELMSTSRWMLKHAADHGVQLLGNYVYAENHTSIRWLKRLGFTIDPAAPYGVCGRSFSYFHQNILHLRQEHNVP